MRCTRLGLLVQYNALIFVFYKNCATCGSRTIGARRKINGTKWKEKRQKRKQCVQNLKNNEKKKNNNRLNNLKKKSHTPAFQQIICPCMGPKRL